MSAKRVVDNLRTVDPADVARYHRALETAADLHSRLAEMTKRAERAEVRVAELEAACNWAHLNVCKRPHLLILAKDIKKYGGAHKALLALYRERERGKVHDE